MRRTFLLGATVAGLAGWACSGAPTAGGKIVPPLPAPDTRQELPAIPTQIAVTESKPTEGTSPDQKSPILDILKAENEREMASLGKTNEPAYYVAYQLVEQRIVSMDAEGGALVTDSDDTARNLDVDVRVGSPKLDNTHQLVDDPNGLNSPLSRQGNVPFGADPEALSNAVWLETARRYHEAVSELGYVMQDQQTLSRKKAADDDFSHEPAEVHIEAPAKLEFDKAALGRAAQALLRQGADPAGQGHARHVRRRVPAQHELLRQQRGLGDPAVLDQRAAVGVRRRQGR